MSTPAKDEDVHIRPFSDWLREQAKGKSHEELGEGLHDLIARVVDTGKKGSITYTVTVEPTKDGGENLVVVTDEIRLRLPEHKRPGNYFWVDGAGNLARQNPNQLAFDSLREVPPPPGVDIVTGEVTSREA